MGAMPIKVECFIDDVAISLAEIGDNCTVDRHNRYDLVIGDNAKGFRAMGKQLGCAVITAAQQKRECLSTRKKDRMDFGPEDISGSEELANDCDNIFYQRILPHSTTRPISRPIIRKNRLFCA